MPRDLIELKSFADEIPGSSSSSISVDFTENLDAALAPGSKRRECARFLDSFQSESYERLAARYGDQTFAKLLALKLTNLAAGRYQLGRRQATLFSYPVLLRVDPSNACQLGCPGCIHSTNTSYRSLFDWPRKMLPLETYEAFLHRFGPFAFCVSLYHYGEPLLNKRFPSMARSAQQYLLRTITSTNLSMPIDNAEAIVESGLDYMILSIDGATQSVYERYRRKGDLGLVLDNVGKLVAAKKALGIATPHLVWQFLTFEHNHHELSDAERMAARLGVNEFAARTPFGVEIDDPSIRAVKSPCEGSRMLDYQRGTKSIEFWSKAIRHRADTIDELFRKAWETRIQQAEWESVAPQARTCPWLYYNLTMDGAARIMPCCMAPDRSEKNLVFANFESSETANALSIVNSPMARLARTAFADRAALEKEVALQPGVQLPYCAKCAEKPVPPYGLEDVRRDIRELDPEGVVSSEVVGKLTAWV
jgi:pyruvate-formate lyase-activating enzyme